MKNNIKKLGWFGFKCQMRKLFDLKKLNKKKRFVGKMTYLQIEKSKEKIKYKLK